MVVRLFTCTLLILLINTCFNVAQEISVSLENTLEAANYNKEGGITPEDKNAIKSAYYEWIYKYSMIKVYKEHIEETHKLLDISNKRYKAGEIDLLEKTQWENRYYEIENRMNQLETEKSIIENNLKMLVLTDRNIVPSQKVLKLYRIERYENAYELFIDNLDGFPEDSIKNHPEEFWLFKEKENALLNLVSVQNQLDHFDKNLIPLAETYYKVGQSKLETEDIDYSEYFLYLSKMFQLQITYLELVNKYNQAALALELIINK